MDKTSPNFWPEVLKCNFIIFDITHNLAQVSEARECLELLEKLENREKMTKYFILISSILTWAKTPIFENPLNDSEYRKRQPHRCYLKHKLLERDVINAQKRNEHLNTIVVCPGIVYGEAENIFHYMFKQLYFNNIEVEIFAPGDNMVPLIYIKDFVQ